PGARVSRSWPISCSRSHDAAESRELLLPRHRLLLHLREGALELRRRRLARGRTGDLLPRRLRGAHAAAFAPHERDPPLLLRGVRARLPDRLLQPRDVRRAIAVREGVGQVPDPFRVPRGGGRLALAARRALLLARA